MLLQLFVTIFTMCFGKMLDVIFRPPTHTPTEMVEKLVKAELKHEEERKKNEQKQIIIKEINNNEKEKKLYAEKISKGEAEYNDPIAQDLHKKGKELLNKLREIAGQNSTQTYPKPDFLKSEKKTLDWAIIGERGLGKSTIINRLIGLKATDVGAAKVGETECTLTPNAYKVTSLPEKIRDQIRFWDMPGLSLTFKKETYVRDFGLRYMRGVIIVTGQTLSESTRDLIKQLDDFDIPWYLVRSKIDQSVRDAFDDYGIQIEETYKTVLSVLIKEMHMIDPLYSDTRVFVVCGKQNVKCPDGWNEFGKQMASDLISQIKFGFDLGFRDSNNSVGQEVWNSLSKKDEISL